VTSGIAATLRYHGCSDPAHGAGTSRVFADHGGEAVQHVHEARAEQRHGTELPKMPGVLPGRLPRGGHAPGGEGVFQVRDGWEGPAGSRTFRVRLAASMRLSSVELSAV